MPSQHEILLTVPALPEFLRVVRVTASGLSTRLGLSIDDVDDLRLALDELCFALIGEGQEDVGLTIRYELSDDALTIRGTTSTQPAGHAVELNEFSEQILTALVDEHKTWHDQEGSHFSVTKRRVALTA